MRGSIENGLVKNQYHRPDTRISDGVPFEPSQEYKDLDDISDDIEFYIREMYSKVTGFRNALEFVRRNVDIERCKTMVDDYEYFAGILEDLNGRVRDMKKDTE